MKFRTEIIIPRAPFAITHQDNILMTGSCFVENMSAQLYHAGFSICVNPFGIVYNPVSAANGLRDLITQKVYTAGNLFLQEGVYHSFAHHSRFSGTNSEAVVEKINTSIAQATQFLQQATLLVVTFGTANTYRHINSGKIVSNCHKVSAREFEEKRLTVEEITTTWNQLIADLQQVNPNLKLLFTVSPIRHWKDGAHENQLSKATLLLAVNELVAANAHCSYFPAYELLLDDLRDYRFYADDLNHPNAQAIAYIWEKFSDAYFEPKTKEKIMEYEKQQKLLNHRPLIF
jgi:lysophospholipase L1-like esterase